MKNLISRLEAAESRLRAEKAEQRGRNVVGRVADKGFTLIELLVVITILGILAAIVVFSVAGIGDKGQTSACKMDKSIVQTAAEAFYANNNTGYYPATEAQLVPNFMSSQSTYYDYVGSGTESPAGSGHFSSYTITPVAPCT